ncbi:MAG: hypothetical protein RLZZ40_1049 [Actinomycetota bacterium]
MELAFLLGGIVALSVILSIPAWRYQKRTGKKLGRAAAVAVMNTVNEIYAPSAHHATEILEEGKERRVAIPSPEGKDFANTRIVIQLRDGSQ